MAAYKITIEEVNKSNSSCIWYDNKIDILLKSEYFDRVLVDGTKFKLRDHIKNILNLEDDVHTGITEQD